MSDPGPHPLRVTITAPIDPDALTELGGLADVVVVPRDPDGLDDGSIVPPDRLAVTDVLVVEASLVTAEVVAAAPELVMVVCCRSAPVNVDLEACRRRGIQVVTTPARNADVTADHTIAMILNCVRQVSKAEAWMRSQAWVPETRYFPYSTFRGPRLGSLTLGVVGFGAIGSRVAARAGGFGMSILAFDPVAPSDPPESIEFVDSLGELLARSDVVSLHAPANQSTRSLLGPEEFDLMRPGAYLINAARASLTDETALVASLSSGRLAGAALDVYHDEPPAADSPLFGLSNVVLTPHIGGASDDVIAFHSAVALDAIRDLVANRSAPTGDGDQLLTPSVEPRSS